ncbi:F0F1 ATP synthase subunit delta [Thermosipho atlanticus]|uniref:ATP synthase subunit delta n=1 Tax=Thermosipho atlanticus DSM 15807 TaxID=1123380 RepID=A0A1M5RTF6_9BACT|nr:F0F1 ATP synthase subunit delta [Thermosipho atlanticus]SHH29338.1 ATP synthase F1 subcomplex delta subunit [Thermosipho atlanticus DSM 15807]
MRYSIVAGKYVKALLIVAKKLQKIENYKVLLNILNMIYTNFSSFLNNPTEKIEKKMEFLEIIYKEVLSQTKEAQYDDIFKKFVEIVFENKRQKYIPQIALMYKYAAIEVENKIPVKVVSATKLSEEEEKVLIEFVRKYTEREPIFEKEIDEDLIAGIILEFAGKRLDISIKGRLEKIGREVFSLRKG